MTTDLFIARLVAVTVCLIGLVTAAAVVFNGSEETQEKLAFLVVGGILGALSTRVSRGKDEPPAEVEIINDESDPVPVNDRGEVSVVMILLIILLVAVLIRLF